MQYEFSIETKFVGNNSTGLGQLMCTQGCRTWLWGGEGDPTYDDGEGQCSCVCNDERWSDHNLLGRASCVPVIAHAIFGWVGLVLSTAALCHVTYHLSRQVSRGHALYCCVGDAPERL